MSTKHTTFPENDYLFPPVSESSRLLVGCRREDYSASRIARAVEDCDAHLLNLNITGLSGGEVCDSDGNPKFPVVFDLRVSHRSAHRISRSLERYGYTVLDTRSSGSDDDDVLQRRIDEFFRYLDI